MAVRIVLALIFACGVGSASAAHSQDSADSPAQPQLWVTMHTAPIDDYCPPCIASEMLLKNSGVEFKKVLEPMGPWPWFQLTDSGGNQRTIRGGLSQEDVDAIKRGEFPKRR